MEERTIAQKSPFVMEMDPGTYYWCRCGKSADQPFCNGSHKGTNITPAEVVLTEKKQVAWCGCKHTADEPFCDGSHKRLP